MRYLVVGSFKGNFPERLREFARDMKTSVVVSLGDFKTPECAAAAYDFLSNYPTIGVPGYIDIRILNALSGRDPQETLKLSGKGAEAARFLGNEKSLAALKAPAEATRPTSFIRYFSLDIGRLGDTYKTAVSYAPLDCTEGSKSEQQEGFPEHFRCRLIERDDFFANFTAMQDRNLSVMIVSEGSEPRYVRYSGTNVVGAHEAAKAGQRNRLERGELHLINPGDIVSGHLAIINTDSVEEGVVMPYLSFHTL